MSLLAHKCVVVTGTDTGVGKTVVAAGLGRALARRGLRVVAVKPIESGCGPEPCPEEDGVRLALATGQDAPRAALVRLRAPVAPPLAADLEGVDLDVDALVERVRRLADAADAVIVEGAGGLLSPLSWERTLIDVAHQLGGAADVPALVVASDRLGTVNHTLLTLRCLAGASVMPLGVVLSAPDAPDASTGTNADALRRVIGSGYGELAARVVGLPRVAGIDEAADRLEDVVRWIMR